MSEKPASAGSPKSTNVGRYFFNISNGGPGSSPQCVDLSSIKEVRREAVKLACATLGEDPDEFWRSGEWQLTVTDERGLNLFSLLILATDSPAAHGR